VSFSWITQIIWRAGFKIGNDDMVFRLTKTRKTGALI